MKPNELWFIALIEPDWLSVPLPRVSFFFEVCNKPLSSAMRENSRAFQKPDDEEEADSQTPLMYSTKTISSYSYKQVKCGNLNGIYEAKTVAKPSPKEDKNSSPAKPKMSSTRSKCNSSTQISTSPNVELQLHDSKKTASAKAQLHDICVANKWMPPAYQCCKEEGPCHMKTFSFKVVVEIKGDSNTTVECFGSPRPKKKDAAENAAEGALWFMRHMDYYHQNK